MNTAPQSSKYSSYLLLLMVASSLLVGCVTPSRINPYIDSASLLDKLQEINKFASEGDTISIRTGKGNQFTFLHFSVDLSYARGVLLATQLNPYDKPEQYTMVDSILTIPRKDIYSIKVHHINTSTANALAGFGVGTAIGYLATFGADEERHSNSGRGIPASTYHLMGLASGITLSLIILGSDEDDIYYYFCPNDNCESIKRDLDRIHLDGRTTW